MTLSGSPAPRSNLHPIRAAAPVRDLDLSEGPLLGRIVRLETNRIEVECPDSQHAAAVTVSGLVALPASDEVLIGLVDSVAGPSGGAAPAASDNGGGAAPAGPSPVRLTLRPVGTVVREDGDGAKFKRGASSFPRIGGTCHLIEGARLRAFMSILADELPEEERLVLGRYVGDADASAIADGNHFFQRHAALLGNTGTGKSWAVATMLERASQLDHANLIVFDLHGEYAPLTRPVDGGEPVARGLRMAGPADLAGASRDILYLPYWLLERDEVMALALNPTDPYASDQVLRFTEHAQRLKQVALVGAGREAAIATFTVDSPIPYSIAHLIHALKGDDTEKIPQPPSNRIEPGPYFGRLTGLISRLEARVADPRYGFIFAPPEETLSYEWLTETAVDLLQAGPGATGIKIVDLSEVPSGVLPVVVGALARLISGIQFWMQPEERTPVCLVCDEAHLYLRDDEAEPLHRAPLRAFEAIAKEGRKYGVGLLVVSQRPTDINRTILSQCNNFLIMRMTNDYDQELMRRLVPEALSGVTDMLPVLDVGEAVAVGDALLLPTRIKLDAPAVRPMSSTRPYWSLWTEQPSSRDAIASGVEALRSQFRPSA